jgi:hypothetical protein
MSDKQKVQMELAQRIVDLTIALPHERMILFVKVYYDTMIREWGGIDRIRMDKYMSFVRKMVHATLRYLQSKEWNMEVVTGVTKVLADGVLCAARTDCRGVSHQSLLFNNHTHIIYNHTPHDIYGCQVSQTYLLDDRRQRIVAIAVCCVEPGVSM